MAYVPGTPGDDGLSGTPGDDLIEGFAGGDFIVATSGNDTIDGGDDWDVVAYWDTLGDLFVDLDSGLVLDGWGGTQTLISIETIFAGGYNNTIYGNEGENHIVLGVGGIDYIDGRDGFDVIFYDGGSTGVGVTIDLVNGYGIDSSGNTDTLLNFEAAHGTEFDDIIRLTTVGSNGGYTFAGGGDDLIFGSAESDGLYAGSGADTVDGGGGLDGVDYLDDTGTQGVVLNLATGVVIDNFGFTDTLISVENAGGSNFGDMLSGSADANYMSGEGGNDTIDAGAGNDWSLGGEGDDRLIDNGAVLESSGPGKGKGHQKDKGKGHDKNEDKPGHAKHHGGTASPDDDYYEGNGGADTFVFRNNNGSDHIADFEEGDAGTDVIDVSDWNVSSFTALMALASSANAGEDTVITLDANSSIYLAGVQSADLRANDFIV